MKAESSRPNGIWLWAAADNLRVAAITAVECAESMIATRPGGKNPMRVVGAAAWLVLLAGATSCGYHTAGHAVQLPENVKTIAVPAFINVTTTYRIEQMLTASVVREFTTRTHYHILNDPSEAADATLRGTVLSTSSTPLTYNSATGQAASVLVVVSMRVSLTDRQGKVCIRILRTCFASSTKFRRTWPAFSKKTRQPSAGSPRISREPWSLTFWRASRC